MNKKSFLFELFSVCRQGFSKGPFEKGGTVKLFFVWKKSYKRSKQACRLTRFAARQLCRTNFFCFRKRSCPVVPISVTPKSKRLGIIGSRKNGFDLTGGFLWEPRHANQIAFHLKMKGFRFVGSVAYVGAGGCLYRSADIPTPLFSPQEALRR